MYSGHAHSQHKVGGGAAVLNVPPTLSMSHTQMPPGIASMGQRTPNLSFRPAHGASSQVATVQQPIPHSHACHASTNCNIKISVASAGLSVGCPDEFRTPKVTLLDDLSDDVNSSTDDCGDCCLVDDSDTYEGTTINNGPSGQENGTEAIGLDDGLLDNDGEDEEDGEGSGVGGDSGDSLGGIYIGPRHWLPDISWDFHNWNGLTNFWQYCLKKL